MLRAILLVALATDAIALVRSPLHERHNRRAALTASTALLMPGVGRAIEAPPPMENIDPSKFRKIPGGGQAADLRIGTGAEVAEGSKVSLQWVLRRSNGYYVDGSIKMLSAQSGAVKVSDSRRCRARTSGPVSGLRVTC